MLISVSVWTLLDTFLCVIYLYYNMEHLLAPASRRLTVNLCEFTISVQIANVHHRGPTSKKLRCDLS